MKKFLIVAGLAMALTTALVGGAGATQPIRNPAEGPGSFTFPAGVVCPFPVFAEALENRQTETIFSNGDIQYTGFFLTGVTNLDKPENTLSLVSQGPARLSFGETTFQLTTRGPIIFFFFPGMRGRVTTAPAVRTSSTGGRRWRSTSQRGCSSRSAAPARRTTSAPRSPSVM